MSEARLSPGHVVAGRYVVHRLIGRGGMGEVYAALDRKLERRVALKVVAAAASDNAKRRLEVEAKAVASIQHPGIVTLHDVVEDGEALVLVMELVGGTSLREALASGPLAPRAVAAVVRGVAEALEAAHDHGLVHRDVKPDNIIVRTDGRTALLDFGVAKAVTPREQSALAATMTGDGGVVGTPAYLAPEQARGDAVTPATDQFALAVTAYELLTGASPWDAREVPAIIAAIVAGAPAPLQGAGDGGAKLDEVFARALAKAPDERFEHVTAFADALGVVLGDDGGNVQSMHEATPDAPLDSPRRPSRGSRSSDRGVAGATRLIGAVDASAPAWRRTPRRTSGPMTPANEPLALRARATPARLAMLAVVLVGTFGLSFWLSRPRALAPAFADPASGASASVTSVDGLEASGAANDADRARFREAARALRRGEVVSARRLVDEVIARDPGFASAQLLRAYLSFMLVDDLDEPARAALRAASNRSDVLSERDAEFLAALTPSFLDPPKWRDTAERLEVAVKKRPRDARAFEALGVARVKLGDYQAGQRAFRAELAVDGGAAIARVVLAQLLSESGDADAALDELRGCVRDQPASSFCRAQLATILANVGDCVGADREARDALSLDPEVRRAATARARATAALGAPNDVVAELLAGRERSAMPSDVPAVRALDAVVLATRVGDFAGALAALDDPALAKAMASGADAADITLARLQTLWEMGERERAADVADAYLKRAAALRKPERVTDDPTGRLLAYLRAAGRISSEEHDKRRAAWLDGWRAARGDVLSKPEQGTYVWPSSYGTPDPPTVDEARTAIAAMEALGFVPRPHPDMSAELLDELGGLAGALLAAGGRDAEADAILTAVTRACRVAPDQRAFLALGALRAKQGDKAGACAAYAEIEQAWRDARPKSVTRDAARAASSKLGCASSR